MTSRPKIVHVSVSSVGCSTHIPKTGQIVRQEKRIIRYGSFACYLLFDFSYLDLLHVDRYGTYALHMLYSSKHCQLTYQMRQ